MGSIEPAFLSGAPVYIGVDLGGSNISGMAFAWQGERYHCVATEKIDTEAKEGYDHVIVRIRSVIAELVGSTNKQNLRPVAVGLCAPGVVTADGRVRVAPNLGWKNVTPLRDLDLTALGISEGEIFLLNDVNAGLMGELTALKPVPPITVAYFCGTGIGGAVAINGQLLTGAHGGAGEVGHMVVRAGGRKSDGVHGSLEAYIGKWAINRRIERELERNRKTIFRKLIKYNLKKTPIKSSTLKKAYLSKDSFARDLLEAYYARYLGIAISQVANLLEPHLVVLGGGIMEALGTELIPHIEDHLAKHALTTPPELRLATLGDSAGPLGAAHYARLSVG